MISIGLDVGREHDPAALAVLLSEGLRPNSHRPSWYALDVGNIELGTDYTDLASISTRLAVDFQKAGHPTVLTIDATGIGAAVLELARRDAPDLHIVGISIGAGHALTRSGEHDYVVGKHRLTEVLQVALEQRGVRLPDTPGGRELHDQLIAFSRRPTRSGYHRHEAAAGHDDLVLALELAMWVGDAMHDQYAGVQP